MFVDTNTCDGSLGVCVCVCVFVRVSLWVYGREKERGRKTVFLRKMSSFCYYDSWSRNCDIDYFYLNAWHLYDMVILVYGHVASRCAHCSATVLFLRGFHVRHEFDIFGCHINMDAVYSSCQGQRPYVVVYSSR
jgi:hypothetical protein